MTKPAAHLRPCGGSRRDPGLRPDAGGGGPVGVEAAGSARGRRHPRRGAEAELAHHIPPHQGHRRALHHRQLQQAHDHARPQGRRRPGQGVPAHRALRRVRPEHAARRGREARLRATTNRRRANPGIIYVSASAYGRVGPMATEAGVDPLLQAFCGWSSSPARPAATARCSATSPTSTSPPARRSSRRAGCPAGPAPHRSGPAHRDRDADRRAVAADDPPRASTSLTGGQPPPLGARPHDDGPPPGVRVPGPGVAGRRREADDAVAPLLPGPRASTTSPPTTGTPPTADRVRRRDELVLAPGRGAASPRSRLAWWALRLTAAAGAPQPACRTSTSCATIPRWWPTSYITDIDTPHFGRIAVEARRGVLEHPGGAGRRRRPAGEHTGRGPGRAGAWLSESPPGRCDGITVVDLPGAVPARSPRCRLGRPRRPRRQGRAARPRRPRARHGPPFVATRQRQRRMGTPPFVALNRGKRSLADRPRRARRGRPRPPPRSSGPTSSSRTSDPGRARPWGSATTTWPRSHPELVYVAVSALGRGGPAGRPARRRAAGAGHGRVPRLARPHRRAARAARRTDVAGLNTGIFACQAALAGCSPGRPARPGPAGGGQSCSAPPAPAGDHVDVAFGPRRLVGLPPRPLHEPARDGLPRRPTARSSSGCGGATARTSTSS